MDPNETLDIVRDATLDRDERVTAASDLEGWINRGGYLPTNYNGHVSTLLRHLEQFIAGHETF